MAQQIINRGNFDNDASADSIRTAFGKDNDNTTELYRSAPFNVKNYGALGNNSNDDTAAIQQAMDDAFASGQTADSRVYFPAGRYRITSTLSWPRGVQLVGGKGRGDLITALTVIQWGGAAGGIMMQLDSPDSNIPFTSMISLGMDGGMDNTDNLTGADSCLRFFSSTAANARPDTGFFIRDCQFGRNRADTIRFEGKGLLNVHMDGCRWDQVNGYAIAVAHGLGNGTISIDEWTFDNGIDGTTRGKGFLHLDGTASDAGHGPYYIYLANSKLDKNATFHAPNALIYLTARSTISTNVVMAHIALENIWAASPVSAGGYAWVGQSTTEDRLFTLAMKNVALGPVSNTLIANTTTPWPYDSDNTKAKRIPFGVWAPWFSDGNPNSSAVTMQARTMIRPLLIGNAAASLVLSPSVTSGSGAPGATDPNGVAFPNGSLYLRTDGAGTTDNLYVRRGAAWVGIA